MCQPALQEITERQLLQAYTRLFLVARGKDGTRSVSLARLGNYDVRMVELAGDSCAPQFWMELYARDMECTLDSCACDDLEQAAIAARYLIAQAGRLDQESIRCPASCH